MSTIAHEHTEAQSLAIVSTNLPSLTVTANDIAAIGAMLTKIANTCKP